MDQENSNHLILQLSDYSQIGSLQEYFSLSVPGVYVSRVAGLPDSGTQGALDLLVVLASSSGLVAAIKVLPDFLRSRKTGLSITMTLKGQPFTLTATNIDQVMPVLEKLLDD